MRSLYRGSVLAPVAMAVHSCAMGISPVPMFSWRAKRHGDPGTPTASRFGVVDPDALRAAVEDRLQIQVAGWGDGITRRPLASVVGSVA